MEDSELDETQPAIYKRTEHSVSRKDIDPDALKVMYRLIRHGYKAYLVGGGVRDLLLGKAPKDFDISTDATPRKVKALFRNCRIIGRRFKLAHIFFRDGKIIEVSTFRDLAEALEPPQRNERGKLIIRDNTYGTERTDALRRDITINGLFYDLSSFSIIDYVGGVEDLNNRIVRVIGNPVERFVEDPVRMLRVVRHAIRAQSRIERETLEALHIHHAVINQASEVRLYEEIKKDLLTGHSLATLRRLSETGLLQHILPELEEGDIHLLDTDHKCAAAIAGIDNMILQGEEVSPTAILSIIAMYIGSITDDTEEILARLPNRNAIQKHLSSAFSFFAVPRKEKERIEKVLSLWLRIITTKPEKLNASALSRRLHISEVLTMLRAMIPDSIEEQNLRIAALEEAVQLKAKERRRERRGSSHKQRKTSGKRRGGNRGNRKIPKKRRL